MSVELKAKLFNACLSYVDSRIFSIQLAIDAATESANDDTKSSAGDKHETGRAMAQLEQEKGRQQLKEALELKQIVLRINPENKSKIISLGSIVYTNNGIFFISIAANKFSIDGIDYFAVSINSPIGKALMGLTENQKVEFNSKLYQITKIS